MQKSKRFASMPVISLEEGRQIGFIKGLVLDHANKKVAALIIEQKGWLKEQKFIPYYKIHSVGSDAITIEKISGAEKAGSLPEIIKLLKEKVGIIGSRIVAENGTLLGYIDEYYVDLVSGAIDGLEFSGKFLNSVIKGRAFLDINFVRTIGKEVVVVTNDAIDNVFKLEGGLQETVKNIRESTSHLWETTLQKTREISTNINKSLDKVKKDKRFGYDEAEDEIEKADDQGQAEKEPEIQVPVEPVKVQPVDENVSEQEELTKSDQPPAEIYKH